MSPDVADQIIELLRRGDDKRAPLRRAGGVA
jgi:hypothetical protein